MENCYKHALLHHFTCLFILAQLLTWVSTKEFLVFGPSEPIVAAPGGEAILPCSLFPVMSVENMEELRWFRSRFSEAVFVYRNQQEQKEEQMAEYSGRTWLVKDQFHQGKAAVRIGNVQEPDSGIYVCFFKRGLFYEEAILELKVAVMGSVPEVDIKGPEDGGLCVVCMTSGWYPKPQVQWRDSRGERLPASTENHIEDAEGLFSMKTTLVVRDSSLGNVTCSTFNPILGQEKAMGMFIPEPFFLQAFPWMPAFAVSVTMMGLLVLGSCCLLRREHLAKLQLRQEWENLRPEQESFQQTKEAALKTTNRRKAAYRAAWRKAKLYADWCKEHFQAWSVTLDPDSTHANLAISQDRMSVTRKDTDMHLDSPFSVLGTEGISSGRRYWEVKIKNGDSSTWTLGVWREDVEKQGWYSECPIRGFWTVGRTNSGYWAYTDTGRASLSLRQVPESVGVFVDYSEGDISFYNMSDMSHIFSFQASFSGTLFPYFRLESGDVSMILSSEEFPVPISILPSLKESLCSQREGLTLGSRVVDSLPEEESQLLPLPSDTLPP
ncbi:butyrophilin subfamily 3 member A2-like isoform X2 [Peromyscus maniculatus bairdii]|uniref:butyrophilin subfamily 3 member A2-like isoform X2 n=1 Tax=Peromyscus maniculatus bairdii TaxID=230844 RepID=UPI003FD2A7D5